MFEIDWSAIFVPERSLAEVVVRGTITYLMLFLIMRFLLKRQSGVIGIADLLVVVLIADAVQNAMAADYKSITEGLVLVLTIVFWNFFVDWLGFRFPALQRLVRAPPLLIVRDGTMIPQNMRKEMITPDELFSQLRQQGIENLAAVAKAFIEGDGQVSVIRVDDDKARGKDSTDAVRR